MLQLRFLASVVIRRSLSDSLAIDALWANAPQYRASLLRECPSFEDIPPQDLLSFDWNQFGVSPFRKGPNPYMAKKTVQLHFCCVAEEARNNSLLSLILGQRQRSGS